MALYFRRDKEGLRWGRCWARVPAWNHTTVSSTSSRLRRARGLIAQRVMVWDRNPPVDRVSSSPRKQCHGMCWSVPLSPWCSWRPSPPRHAPVRPTNSQVPSTLRPHWRRQISGEPGGTKALLGTHLLAGGGRGSPYLHQGLTFTTCTTSHTTSEKLKAGYVTSPCL